MTDRSRDEILDEVGSSTRAFSHGRGGAGNIGKDRRPSQGPSELITPTIKATTYTTGRGGTGNMAKNDKGRPEVARASQDVEGPTPKDFDTHHIGRGGAGNAATADKGSKSAHKRRSSEVERQAGDESTLKKGRELLEKVGLKM